MKFQKFKLKNGITLLFEKRDLPVVCYSVSNPFGGAYETSDIKGVAHLFEHLLFTGTKTRTHEDISSEIEKKGGILNAFTSQEVTSYWCKMPAEHLPIAMDIIHDILKNPIFEEQKFEKEKNVVLEEIKMFRDDPERMAYELLERALYEKPFGEGVIGSPETVKALSRKKIIEIFKEKYSPENFIVTVVGNADINYIIERLEKEFTPLGKKYVPLKIVKKNENITESRKDISQTQLIVGMHAPLKDSEQYSLEVLNAYLAGGMSSKLFLEIREKHGLAYTVRGIIEREKNFSLYSIYAGTTKEAVDKVKDMIIQGLKDVEDISGKQVEDSKERLIGLRKIASEESISVMQKLIFSEIANGKSEDFYNYESEIRKVSLEDVKLVARDLLKNYSVVKLVPE